jgi:hypothetical protein
MAATAMIHQYLVLFIYLPLPDAGLPALAAANGLATPPLPVGRGRHPQLRRITVLVGRITDCRGAA